MALALGWAISEQPADDIRSGIGPRPGASMNIFASIPSDYETTNSWQMSGGVGGEAWMAGSSGACSILLQPRRLARAAVILRPSTILGIHRALVQRKYGRLFGSRAERRRPGQPTLAITCGNRLAAASFSCLSPHDYEFAMHTAYRPLAPAVCPRHRSPESSLLDLTRVLLRRPPTATGDLNPANTRGRSPFLRLGRRLRLLPGVARAVLRPVRDCRPRRANKWQRCDG
jgi:hypothetical protein